MPREAGRAPGGYAADVTGARKALGRWIRSDAARVDLALAVGTALVTTFGIWVEVTYATLPVPPLAGAVLLGLAASATLLARRRAPVLAGIAALILVYAYHLLGNPGEAPGLVFFVAFYSVTAQGRGIRSIFVGFALVVAAEFVAVIPPYPQPWYSPAVIAPTASMASAVLLGAFVRQRFVSAAARSARIVADAESALRERLAQERLQIARDLHDVLAHTLSIVSVQAGVALDNLEDDPTQARKAMTTVRSLVREVLPQLRVTLGALRGEAGASGRRGETGAADASGELGVPAETIAPQPRLAQLRTVVERARSSGLDVRLSLPESSVALTPFVELTVYRIVTEALTNVLSHSDATAVTVDVAVAEGWVSVEVVDNGQATGVGGAGFGLIGMRERAQLVGGTVHAGPHESGGFRVSVQLPTEAP